MRTRTSRFIGIFTLFLIAFTVLPAHAVFAEGVNFGISPTNGNDGYFVFAAKPGEVIQDSVSVSNSSDQAQVILMMAVSGHTASGGRTSLSFDSVDGTAEWIVTNSSALNENQVEIPAKSQVDIPFTLTIPADAAPGEYAAGFLATSVSQNNSAQPIAAANLNDKNSSMQIRVVTQIGVMVMITVGDSSDITCKIAIEKFVRDISYARWNLGLQLHNTGNHHFIGSGSLTVRPAAGGSPVLTRNFEVGYFVAGDTILYPLFDIIPPVGQYVAEVVVTDANNAACTAAFTEGFSISGPEMQAAVQQQQEFSNQPVVQKAWHEYPIIVVGLTLLIISGMAFAAVLIYFLIFKHRKEAKK